MTDATRQARRRFLHTAGGLALAAGLMPLAPRQALAGLSANRTLAGLPDARTLAFDHTHTGERVSLVYAVGDRFVPDALTTLNGFLRDHYSGKVGMIDPQLFDLLFQVRRELGTDQPFQVISGYRSPTTNSRLRNTRGGGVARHSLHMDGKAIDIRLAGVPLADVRDAAKSLQGGGVGFYESDQFVHIDTGRVRYW
ncbi:Twin-arginine translocation pathway signal protein [Cupriavidus necator]|uniref:YcbK family protein n=1 Tax=Cupriavidus necator TaxID=106590 RepID=UPI003F73E3E0